MVKPRTNSFVPNIGRRKRRLTSSLIEQARRHAIAAAASSAAFYPDNVASNSSRIGNHPRDDRPTEPTTCEESNRDAHPNDIPQPDQVRRLRGEVVESSSRLDDTTQSTKSNSNTGRRRYASKTKSVPSLFGNPISKTKNASKSKKSPNRKPRRSSKSKNEKNKTTTLSSISKARSVSREAWMCGFCGSVFSGLSAAEEHERFCVKYACEHGGLLVAEGFASDDKRDRLRRGLDGRGETSLFEPVRRYNDRHSEDGSGTNRYRQIPPSATFVERNGSNSAVPNANSPPKPPTIPSPSPRTLKNSMSSNRRNSNRSSSSSFGGSMNPLSKFQLPKSKRTTIVPNDYIVNVSENVHQFMLMTDDALRKVVGLSTPHVLRLNCIDAERELALMARDRAYYDRNADDSSVDRCGGAAKRFPGRGMKAKLQNKLAEAYDLIKEGDSKNAARDQYNRKFQQSRGDIHHDKNTMYVNVVVKNSIKVVNNELKRLARLRWDEFEVSNTENQFLRFRAAAQLRMIQLAGFALAHDFTPRRIAVQLSNDLYRLLVPQLKHRGITIETEIEYRLGSFFVLGVNVKDVNWTQLIAYTHHELSRRLRLEKALKSERATKHKLMSQQTNNKGSMTTMSTTTETTKPKTVDSSLPRFFPSKFEAIEYLLYSLYYVHWIVSVPVCRVFFFVIGRSLMHMYILTSVTDDIFRYVEKKGMEMSIKVDNAQSQAPFMLAILREQRADELKLKKQKEQGGRDTDEDEGIVLGPLLGPSIKDDGDIAAAAEEFEPPVGLEFEGIDITLPVGFRRLRWALLCAESTFMAEAVWRIDAKYENIVQEDWSRHNEYIGMPNLPEDIDPSEFIGAERKNSYLMPKSAFVKANTAYETVTLTEYNDHCFAVKKCTRTPEVPFGETFLAWTQVIVINTGTNSCRMICSMEAEFPNGQPMVARQIKSGMRSGVTEFFTLFSGTIVRYANAFP